MDGMDGSRNAGRRQETQEERNTTPAVISAADAMRLPEPEPVLRHDVDDDTVAVVCSVGEPAILSGPGGSGKSWITLAWARAAAEAAGEVEEAIAVTKAEAQAAAEAVAEARDEAVFVADSITESIAEAASEVAAATEAAAAEEAESETDVVAAAFLRPSPVSAAEFADDANAIADAVVEAELEELAEYAADATSEAEAATKTHVPWTTACGLAVRPGPVVLVSYEDQPARIAARLRAMETPDAALRRLYIVVDPEPLWRPADRLAGGASETVTFRALSARLNALRPSLVVLDPIAAAAGSLNLSDGGAARCVMRSLAKLSLTLGAGVLVVAHDTKSSRDAGRAGKLPGAGAVGGSAQWFDAARGVLYLRGGPEDHPNTDRELVALKVNNGTEGWVVPLSDDKTGDGVFAGFRRVATPNERSKDGERVTEDPCSDPVSEEDIPF